MFTIICGIFVLLAVTGIFDHRAYGFSNEVSERSLHFLDLAGDIKEILTAIGEIKIPFISGHVQGIESSVDDVYDFLMVVNSLSLLQLMLLGVAKSWVFKILLIGIFVWHIFKTDHRVSRRFLVLALIVAPGLPIFTTLVQTAAHETSIDLGSTYVHELDSTVQAIRAEKAELMHEHQRTMAEINNGRHGVEFFKKLKEDVAYDVKRVTTDITGDYKEIRIIVHSGGKVIVRKLTIFCTMLIFCFLVLPFGYLIFMFTLYRTVMRKKHAPPKEAEG